MSGPAVFEWELDAGSNPSAYADGSLSMYREAARS
jgi:hypothetical protein